MSSSNDEYYTPPAEIEIARSFLGTIDLDPASNEIAQQWIQAGTFWTKADNGYTKPWTFKKVFCNPPYCADREGEYGGGKNVAATLYWLDKALGEYAAGRVEEIILLVNRSDGKWYHDRVPQFHAYYERRERIKFIGTNAKGEKATSPRYSNDYLYLGHRPQQFFDHYAAHLGEPVPHSFALLDAKQNRLAPGQRWQKGKDIYSIVEIAAGYPSCEQMVVCDHTVTRSMMVCKVDILTAHFKHIRT
jgi:DNA N-6-adenine-methyltransferase (Dam)